MKGNRRSFSTLSGLLWVVSFLTILFIYPLVFKSTRGDFSQPTSQHTNQTSFFPLETRLTVFRAGDNAKTKSRNSKISIKELIKDSPSPVLINFWATWCPPCLEELPSVEMLSKQLANQQPKGSKALPQLITISVDDRLEDIAKLESTLDFKPSFTVLHDKEGELARSMGTTKFPETYLVSPQGKILYKWLGPQDWLSADALRQIKANLQ